MRESWTLEETRKTKLEVIENHIQLIDYYILYDLLII